MSLFDSLALLVPQAARPPDGDDYWYEPAVRASTAAGGISPDGALRISAAYSAVQVLAQTVASIPLNVYRRLPNDKGREIAWDHPLHDLLHRQPNPWQTSFEWREMCTGHLCLRGNAYNYIQPGRRGAVDQLIPLHPARMKVYALPENRIGYEWVNQHGKTQYFTQEEIFHLKYWSDDGLVGMSPVTLQARTLKTAQSHEEYEEDFFDNNAKPGAVLQSDKPLGEDAQNRLIASWAKFSQPGNRHKTVVLEDGLKWQQVGMTNEDAQTLESSKQTRSEVAAIWRVPGYMIGEMGDTSYNNIAEMARSLVTMTMLPLFERWEQAIGRDLITDPKTYFASFVAAGLMQGDHKTRAEFYQAMFMIGVFSINDIRRLENMNPIDHPAADWHFVPLNMTPLNQAGAAVADRNSMSMSMLAATLQEAGVQQGAASTLPGVDAQSEVLVIKPDASDATAEARTQSTPEDLAGTRDDLQPIIEDAAGRIARMEWRGLSTRAKHAPKDRPRWTSWLAHWESTKHTDFVQKTLRPLASLRGADAQVWAEHLAIKPDVELGEESQYLKERTEEIVAYLSQPQNEEKLNGHDERGS